MVLIISIWRFAMFLPISSLAQQCSSSIPCPQDLCCSKYGWCGSTEEHCLVDKGCVSNCKDAIHPTLYDNLCGPAHFNRTCPSLQCCQENGKCGYCPNRSQDAWNINFMNSYISEKKPIITTSTMKTSVTSEKTHSTSVPLELGSKKVEVAVVTVTTLVLVTETAFPQSPALAVHSSTSSSDVASITSGSLNLMTPLQLFTLPIQFSSASASTATET